MAIFNIFMTHLLFWGMVVCLQPAVGFFKWQLYWKTADVIAFANLCEDFLKDELLWECELLLKQKDYVFLVLIWGKSLYSLKK